MSITKNLETITNLYEWQRLAPPKSLEQWVDGRSAKELARLWLESLPDIPYQIIDPIQEHDDFGEILNWNAEPEAKLKFDERRGETRNSDLLVEVKDKRGNYIIAVEAKADEPFDSILTKKIEVAIEKKLENSSSQRIDRILDLIYSLIPTAKLKGNLNTVASLRYQLFSGVAGALAEGVRRKCNRVVFAVQEFKTFKTRDENLALNKQDIDSFIERISDHTIDSLSENHIVGPIRVPGRPLIQQTPDLYFLKSVHDLR